MGITRRETRHAQYSQRVFGEGGGDVSERASGEVGLAVVGVDQAALLILGHGIDGKVAADQVVFEGDVGTGIEGEAAVAAPAFALGTGQRILLASLGMQENREVRAHRAKAQRLHLLGAGADHYPIHFGYGTTQQTIPYRPADFIDLHATLRSGRRIKDYRRETDP